MGMTFSSLLGKHESWLKNQYNAYLLESRGDRERAIAEAEKIAWIVSKNEERVRQGTWSASSAGTCLRKQQFVYLGFEGIKHGAQTLNIFANGDYMHLRHQAAGLVAGYLTDVEIPLYIDTFFVRGTADGYCSDGSIVDFKSMSPFQFSPLTEPKPEHVRQLHSYMAASGRRISRLLYENKATQEMKEYLVEWDDKINDQNEEDWYQLNCFDEEERLAPRTDNPNECQFCEFRNICGEVTYEDRPRSN